MSGLETTVVDDVCLGDAAPASATALWGAARGATQDPAGGAGRPAAVPAAAPVSDETDYEYFRTTRSPRRNCIAALAGGRCRQLERGPRANPRRLANRGPHASFPDGLPVQSWRRCSHPHRMIGRAWRISCVGGDDELAQNLTTAERDDQRGLPAAAGRPMSFLDAADNRRGVVLRPMNASPSRERGLHRVHGYRDMPQFTLIRRTAGGLPTGGQDRRRGPRAGPTPTRARIHPATRPAAAAVDAQPAGAGARGGGRREESVDGVCPRASLSPFIYFSQQKRASRHFTSVQRRRLRSTPKPRPRS